MNLRTIFVGILWGGAAALATMALLAGNARADTILLRNGTVYQGRIVSDRPDRVILTVNGVEVRVPRMNIDEITREGPPYGPARDHAVDDAANAYLEKIARDTTATVEWRLSSIRALGASGGPSALKVLAELLGSDAPTIRDAACVAFIGSAEAPLDAGVRRALELHAESNEPGLRRAAMRCLGTGEAASDYILASHATIDPDESVRVAAVESLGRSHSDFARAVLERARHDPSSEVRVLATRALELLRRAAAAPATATTVKASVTASR